MAAVYSQVALGALAGVLMLAMGVMGARGSLPRNGWAGIRLPVTMASDEAWRVTHRAAAGWLVAAGVAGLAGSVAALVGATAGWSSDRVSQLVGAGVVVLAVLVLVGGVVGTRAASRLR